VAHIEPNLRQTVSETDEERSLRIDQMTADITNKTADTDYKRGLLRYEPWKVVGLAFGAGAAVMGAAVALVTSFVRAVGH
jgi:hypothetical protein